MIGIFDSGIGGLTVVRELMRVAPRTSFVYLGDTARTPYGNKSSRTIRRYAIEDVRYLISRGAETIIVACNTVSATAMDTLRIAFPNIRFIDVVTPAAKEAAKITHGRIGVVGTRATIDSKIYQQLLEHAGIITAQACPIFVPLIEEGWSDRLETKRIVRHELAPLKRMRVDTLILGCTHYPIFESVIHSVMGKRVLIVNSASAVVEQIVRQGLLVPASTDILTQIFAFTDPASHTIRLAERWIGRVISIELADVGIV